MPRLLMCSVHETKCWVKPLSLSYFIMVAAKTNTDFVFWKPGASATDR